MTRRRRQRLAVTIEVVVRATPHRDGPGVPLFHVERYGNIADIWLYRDARGALRVIGPRRGLGTPLPDAWYPTPDGDWPPLAQLIAAAFPDELGAA